MGYYGVGASHRTGHAQPVLLAWHTDCAGGEPFCGHPGMQSDGLRGGGNLERRTSSHSFRRNGKNDSPVLVPRDSAGIRIQLAAARRLANLVGRTHHPAGHHSLGVGRLPRMRCDRRAADDSVVEKTPQGLKTPAILLTPFDTEPVERSARTPACRVHTHVNAWDSVAV